MAFLKIGEKDQDGRQKRIEHTGPYLRASRTGGLSLRAQTRVAGINLTGNTRHGLRVSTRLAKNTQVAFYAAFAIFAGILWVLGVLLRGLGGLFTGVGRWTAANRARRELAEEEAARPRFNLIAEAMAVKVVLEGEA